MNQRLSALVLLLALACTIAITPLTAAAAPREAPAQQVAGLPITGSGPNATFNGVFNVTKFALRSGQLVAIGTLTGQLTNTATNVTRTVTKQIALPVGTAQATCTVLDLTLGPLDLNLLGLLVHLNQVHLVIQADPTGGLLGQLLCAVANLLNNNGPLRSIVDLLNQILGQL